MAVASIQKSPFQSTLSRSKPKRVSWEKFKKKFLTREDSWKYEWVNGLVEKTKRTMYPHHVYILYNLRQTFTKLEIGKKVSGLLESEIDIFILDNIHRRPDLSYFSTRQNALMAHGELSIPKFVIEIVSSNEMLPKGNQKMKQYREAGIRVVWQIFPDSEEVHVIRGKDMTVCIGEDICSADPVLPEFEMTVRDVFKKPPKPKSLV